MYQENENIILVSKSNILFTSSVKFLLHFIFVRLIKALEQNGKHFCLNICRKLQFSKFLQVAKNNKIAKVEELQNYDIAVFCVVLQFFSFRLCSFCKKAKKAKLSKIQSPPSTKGTQYTS